MRILLPAMAAMLCQVLFFTAAGCTALKIAGRRDFELSTAFIAGYISWFFLFEIVAVPMTFLRMQLHTLTIAMTGVGAVMVIFCALWCRSIFSSAAARVKPAIKEHSFAGLLAAAAVGLLCLQTALYVDKSIDAAYYVAQSASVLYHDHLVKYNPYTGYFASSIVPRYAFSAYPLHNAVFAQLCRVPAIVQARVTMPAINMFTACLIWHRTARELAGRNKIIIADLALVFIALIHFALADTLYTSSTFLLTRMYEGKSILANLMLPALLLCCIRLYGDDTDRAAWWGMLAIHGAALCFAGTGIIAGALSAAAMIPLAVRRKKIRIFLNLLITYIPVLIWGTGQILAAAGVIPLKLR